MSITKRSIFVMATLCLLANGCVSVRTSHGYILERGENELSARLGLDTKESVIARYGEPSMRATFDDDAWYYLANRDQARAFFRPEVTSQTVVVFRFDGEGVVEEVDTLDLSNSVKLSMSGDSTPTRGKELSFWEQLLGNVGRLPAAAGGPGIGGGGPGGP
ncbi:MAG: outer membrane protein assembly factor BamE [Pseudomonadota bacterium]